MKLIKQGLRLESLKSSSEIRHYLISILTIGGTAILCAPFSGYLNYHMVSFILLFVVSLLSTFLGIGPILLASTLSALAWDYFFIPPHYTFKIEKPEDILILGLFFIIVVVNGIMTTRIRRQEMVAREREKRTHALFLLSRGLSGASGMEEVTKAATEAIQKYFSFDPCFILQDGNHKLEVNNCKPFLKRLTQEEIQVAQWVFAHSREAGALTANPFAVESTFFPLTGTRINPGVVMFRQSKTMGHEQKSFWYTFIAQVSNAMEREFLGELAQKVRFLDESDRLYKTLFNSISHELRIPVATIMGASDSILHSGNSKNVQSALCREIFTASVRLNRLIENLLNMSRIESGHISLRPDWVDVNDLVNKVAEDLKEELKPFSLNFSVAEEMPLVWLDFGIMEQVLYNLLFNATQYAPAASDIGLKACYLDGSLDVEITDEGPGFPEEVIGQVFQKFFKVSAGKTGGLGLGLSIVKGFVTAHNGTISIENRDKGGTKFTLRIPSGKPDMINLQN